MKDGLKLSVPTMVKLRKIPPDEFVVVMRWIRDGEDALSIMQRHGIRLDTALVNYRKSGLLAPERGVSGRYPRVPDEVRAAVMADYKAGMRMAEIERRHGVHRWTVWAIRRETGVPLRYPKMGWRRRPKPPDVVGYYIEGPSPVGLTEA